MKKSKIVILLFLLLLSLLCLAACQGEKGIQGIQGDKGDKGEIGPQGEKGDTGPQGDKGEKGNEGQDASDVELSYTSDGIVWKYVDESDECWKPVISFDELFKYKQTYTITLNTNGGNYSGETTLNNIIYLTELTLGEPELEGFEFVGWYDDEDNLLLDNYLVVESDYSFTAKYKATILLEGLENAKGEPLFEYEDVPLATLINNIAEAFMDDVNDSAIKLGIITSPIDKQDFYDEFENKLCDIKCVKKVWSFDENDLFYRDPALFKKWSWLVQFACSLAGDNKDGNNEFVNQELKMWGLQPYGADAPTSDYDFCDKLVTLSIHDFLNSYSGQSKSYSGYYMHLSKYNPPSDFSVEGAYDGLYTYLDTSVNELVELGVGETYTLPTVIKSGYKFLGWFIVDENGNFTSEQITVLTNAHVGKTIKAKWEAKK